MSKRIISSTKLSSGRRVAPESTYRVIPNSISSSSGPPVHSRGPTGKLPFLKDAWQFTVMLALGEPTSFAMWPGRIASKSMVELNRALSGHGGLPGMPVLEESMCISRRGMCHSSVEALLFLLRIDVVGKAREMGKRSTSAMSIGDASNGVCITQSTMN